MKKSNFWKIAFLVQSCISILITGYFLTEINQLEKGVNIKRELSIENIHDEIAIEVDFETIAKAIVRRLDTSDFRKLIYKQAQKTKTTFTNRLSLEYYDIHFDSTGKVESIDRPFKCE